MNYCTLYQIFGLLVPILCSLFLSLNNSLPTHTQCTSLSPLNPFRFSFTPPWRLNRSHRNIKINLLSRQIHTYTSVHVGRTRKHNSTVMHVRNREATECNELRLFGCTVAWMVVFPECRVVCSCIVSLVLVCLLFLLLPLFPPCFSHNPNSKKTQIIAGIPNVGLCQRCHDIIEWRKKFRKYKPIKNLAKWYIMTRTTR
jgi:hypothetical protein